MSHETNMPELRNLRRSTDDKLIAGICAGIAEWLGWKTSMVRILFVVGFFFAGHTGICSISDSLGDYSAKTSAAMTSAGLV